MKISAPLRICHVVTSLETGGAEHQLERVMSMVPQRHTVISLRDRGIVGKRLEAAGIPVHPLRLAGPASWPRGLLELRRRIREFDPEIIQGWMYHGNLASVFGAYRLRIPIFWNVRHSLHDIALEPWRTRVAIRASALLAGWPRIIVYNSEAAARQHEAIGYPGAARRVIPNGFDTTALCRNPSRGEALRRKLGIPERACVAGVVARYHPMKDHIGFVDSAQRVVRELPDARFVFAGRGVDAGNRKLLEAIDSAGLRSNIHLLGECDDLVALYSALDVLCCVSAWGESFPNVVGEAMSCATPCVVTDVGDASRIVDDTGLTVGPRDYPGISDAVIALLRDKNRRRDLGDAARRRIQAYYELNTVSEAYARLWNVVD